MQAILFESPRSSNNVYATSGMTPK
jgi:hypothetical protein